MNATAAADGDGLRAVGLSVARGARRLLHDVNLHLAPGTLGLLCGANGAGKSTLLEVLAGHRALAGGELLLDGRALDGWPRRARARRVALLPQDEAPGYDGRVRAFVGLGRLPWDRRDGGWIRTLAEGHRDPVVDEELDAFGLADVAEAPLRELSGGQRQRARLAQLFAQRAGLLLLDEPATFLDLANQSLLQRRLRAHCRLQAGAALVVVHPSGWPVGAGQPLALVLPDGRVTCGEAQALLDGGLVEQALGCRLRRFRHEDHEVWLPA
jgi:iron complex transport system ATP-binding protein